MDKCSENHTPVYKIIYRGAEYYLQTWVVSLWVVSWEKNFWNSCWYCFFRKTQL